MTFAGFDFAPVVALLLVLERHGWAYTGDLGPHWQPAAIRRCLSGVSS